MVLLLLGGTLVQLAATEVHLRYVRPGHRWLLLAAGVVAVVLAVAALVGDGRRARAARSGPDHGHGAVERHTPWLLLVPVLVVALAAPPALGADALDRVGAGSAGLGSSAVDDLLPPLPPGPAPEVPVAEFVQRAVWGSSGSLEGREITLTGFVVRRGAAVELARLTVMCCAADARANRVRLVGDVGAVDTDAWLRVRGTLQPGSATAASGYVPALTVTAAQPVPPPPDPYEY